MLPTQGHMFGEPAQDASLRRDSVLAARFVMPPFSVLDARQGDWQQRKRAWLGLGIQSELGRGEDLSNSGAGPLATAVVDGAGARGPAVNGHAPSPTYESDGYTSSTGNDGKAFRIHRDTERLAPRPKAQGHDTRPGRAAGEYRGGDAWLSTARPGNGKPDAKSMNDHAWLATHGKATMSGRHSPNGSTGLLGFSEQAASFDHYRVQNGERSETQASGTSIFDPVLCELAYRWWCPPGGAVLDPFAGGSVRGIVAACLGRRYTGIDLRPEQVAANREQAAAIVPDMPPAWHTGDSRDAAELAPGTYDFVFTCPPYADLERYSSDPRDVSTMGYPAFLGAYRHIIAVASDLLAPNRFACIVIGNVRGPDGCYRDLVAETTAAFAVAGLRLYNEAVLVTAVGSLAIRVGKQFASGRKLGKSHQQVLVFVKGDWRKAAGACAEVA